MKNGIPFEPIVTTPRTYDEFSKEELIRMADSTITEYNNGKSLSSVDVESKIRGKY